MNNFILIIHVISATIWTGGHLILSIVLLPNIIRTNDVNSLIAFEKKYEKIGMPALIVQVISGLYLSYKILPDISSWFSFSNNIATHIFLKLLLLLITILLAANANFRLIPQLNKGSNFKIFVYHILAVTVISIMFVVVGLSFRLNLI